MDAAIQHQLSQENLTPFHSKMLGHCKSLVAMSRQAMSTHYSAWDRHDDIYNGIRQADDDDQKAAERSEPIKMIVPLTKAQIQTAVAFCLSLYTQRPNVFEMEGTGVEDAKAAKIASATLQRDLEENNYNRYYYQWLVDIFKFGVGIGKHSWVRETQRTPVEKTIPGITVGPFQLIADRTETVIEENTKFLGNRLYNVSPYRFFPDPRLPLTRFQEGEFCASEDEVPRTQLLRMQHDGVYAGVKHVKSWGKAEWDSRGGSDRNRLPFSGHIEMAASATTSKSGSESSGRAITITEIQIDIVPKEFMIDEATPLGPEDYPVKYIVCIANDTRVIRCEPMGYIHDSFTYDVAQYDPDQHHFLNGGLAETIDELQSVITWLINAHITAVRKSIQNLLVVDPSMINMQDLADRKPIIRTTKGASMSGVDRYIKQLEIRDVTQNNIKDASMLGQVVQTITGVNENAQGQYSGGRRSAEQTKAVNTGAATRLKITAMLIWSSGLLPQGKKMLSNLRDGLDEETFVKVLGLQTLQPADSTTVSVQDFVQHFKVTKKDLVGAYDFAALDGTLPTDKSRIASILQDVLTACMSNPQVAGIFGFDPRALLQEILELQGIRNPERFKVQQTLPPGGLEQMQLMQQQQQVNQQQSIDQQTANAATSQAQTAAQPPQVDEKELMEIMSKLSPEVLQQIAA